MLKPSFLGSQRFILTGFILGGVLLALLVAGLVYQIQHVDHQQQFERRAELGFQSIVRNLSSAQALMDALVGLNQAGDEIDPYLYTPFSEKILQEYPFINSIQYLSYISNAEKDLFIEDMKELGFSQFKIHALQSGQVASAQSYYLVTSFIEPLTPSSARFMGFEWIGSHAIQHEIDKAVAENAMIMLNAPKFMQAPGHFVLLNPTYFGRTINEKPEQRREQLSGLFLISVDWQSLIAASLLQKQNNLKVQFSASVNNDLYVPDRQLNRRMAENSTFYLLRSFSIGSSTINILAESAPVTQTQDFVKIILWVMTVLSIYIFIVMSGRRRYLDGMEKSKVQMQLFKAREEAEVTLQSIGDGVISIGINSEVKYINPVAEKMCQIELQQALGKPINEIVKLINLPASSVIKDPVEYYLEKTQNPHARAGSDIALNVAGSIISIDGNASPLVDIEGELIGFVLVLRDVSLERQLTNELVYQASHDALTGLVNRLEFENKLREVLELSRQQDREYALCYLDMDQFKLINDTCGHIAGDELLKQVSGLLLQQMREDDLVARLGGDEFGILINECDLEMAEDIAERVRQGLNDFHFSWQDKIFDVSASIGLVMINRLSGSLSELLSSADLACYAAKDAGRNMVHTYQADDEEIAQKFSQMQWLPRIKLALQENEFDLAVQSIVSIKPGASPASICEFLIRWPQADGSFISPGVFIPSAERYDLMRDVDRWIIQHALRAIPLLEQSVEPAGSQMYTINLSGQSVGDSGLSDYIWQQILANNVNPETLCFEITETVAIANFSVASDFINSLRERGCRFALDDFGSGLSSFGYLKRLPLDFLKIDGLFVRDMLKDQVDLAMVRTIHDVARVLKLKTIAEWVEDEQVYLALQEIGVDYAQGFFLDKPRMVHEVLAETVADTSSSQVSQ